MHPALPTKPQLLRHLKPRNVIAFPRKRSFERFALVGVANTVFGFSFFPVLHLLTRQALSFDAALIVSYMVCSLVSFASHRLITFRSREAIWPELARYAMLAAITYGLNRCLLWLLADRIPLPLLATQMLIAAVLLVVTYLWLARIVFPDRKRNSAISVRG